MPPFVPPAEEPPGEQPPEPSSEDGLPYLRFYHSAELRERTLAIVRNIERASDPARHRDALADVVMELTGSGLSYYFLRPLDLANVNVVLQQSARLGIGSFMRVMGPVVHNVIGRLDKQQLLTICAHIRALME